jgi:hypothetical protein
MACPPALKKRNKSMNIKKITVGLEGRTIGSFPCAWGMILPLTSAKETGIYMTPLEMVSAMLEFRSGHATCLSNTDCTK